MTFYDHITLDEVGLGVRIQIKDDEGELITGKVIELALLGDDLQDIRVTLQLKDGSQVRLDRDPEVHVLPIMSV